MGNTAVSLSASDNSNDKRIVFIRHGCTHMNEYLGLPGKSWGSPNFSDVFTEDIEKYQDSTLSRRGTGQANSLAKRLLDLIQGKRNAHFPLRVKDADKDFLKDLDLVVVSPLTRALQTFELGLYPVLQQSEFGREIPVICLPEAAERLYLISDIGKTRTELESKYGNLSVDFDTGFWRDGERHETWWFRLDDDSSVTPACPSGIDSKTYQEWRPSSQNQEYACPGEPDEIFEDRMIRLYTWLRDRPEETIAVVCHWGVIDWFLDLDFGNCELRVVPFSEIRPVSLVESKSALLS